MHLHHHVWQLSAKFLHACVRALALFLREKDVDDLGGDRKVQQILVGIAAASFFFPNGHQLVDMFLVGKHPVRDILQLLLVVQPPADFLGRVDPDPPGEV